MGYKKTILSDKWVLEINSDNLDLVNRWRNEEFKFENIGYPFYKYVSYAGYGRGINDWPCITTEEFKEHILKDTTVYYNEDASDLINLLKNLE